jgi:hypothetical protein
MTDEIRSILRNQLADAMTAYDYHSATAKNLIEDAGKCYCEQNAAEDDEEYTGCVCDPDADRDRALAATEAVLAQAAATMVNAMATLLAGNEE